MRGARRTVGLLAAALLLAGLPACSGSGEDVAPGPSGEIAFASDREGNFDIYVMNADGSGQTRLTDGPATDTEPAWSPDRTKIAFWSFRDGNSQIYVMNADGTGQRRITNNRASDFRPAWSSDGTKIVFTSTRDGGNWEIYVMDADGGGQTNLSNNLLKEDVGSDWRPGAGQ